MIVEVCENPNVLKIIYFIKELLNIIFFLAPMGLIVMVSIDLVKNVIAKDNEQMQKNVKIAGKRIIFAVGMFLVYIVTEFTMSHLVENNDDANWLDCYTNAELDSISNFQATYDALKENYEDSEQVPEPNFNKGNNYTITSENKNTEEFLKIAEKLWKQVATSSFSYEVPNNIPITGTKINCSSYVSWVLYVYGYKDEFGGEQHYTEQFVKTDWTKNGWTEIKFNGGEDVRDKLQPGDILVRDSGNNDGHMNIIVSVENGKVLAYDCGSASNWNNSNGGQAIDKTSFAQSDRRPGKIIRVSPPQS